MVVYMYTKIVHCYPVTVLYNLRLRNMQKIYIGIISLVLISIGFAVYATTQTWTKNTIDSDSGFGSSGGLYVTDFDEDGDQDVLVADNGYDKVWWYENDGTASFTRRTVGSSVTDIRWVAPVDLDKDNDIDIIGFAPDSGDEVMWFENDGTDLSFTEHQIGTANGLIHGVPIDMDDDGDWDIVAAAFSESKIYWYENNGSQSFTRYTVDSSISGVAKVYPIDLDEDGDMDIIGKGTYDFSWYENNGSEIFTEHAISAQSFVSGIEVVDLDGDSDLDIVSGKSTIYWYRNNGSEIFTEIEGCTGTPGVSDLDVTDMDGDGDYDFVGINWANAASIDLHWCENDGSQNFTYSEIDSSLSYTRSIATGDIDGDGDQDIISGDENLYWYGVTLSNPLASSTSPVDGITGVATDANLQITFDQAIGTTGTGTVSIYTSVGDTLVEQIPVTGSLVSGSGTTTMTINPTSDLDEITSYYVQISLNAFPNESGMSYLGISDATTWNFTTADETAPTFSSVTASAGTGSATITWATNESGSSLVQYGTTSALGSATSEADTSPRVKSHSVSLSSLTTCATYYYRAISSDTTGNSGTGSTVNFTTTGCTGDSTVEASSGATIDTGAGGTVGINNSGTGITLTIPANFASNDATFQVKELEPLSVIAVTSTPSGYKRVGRMYNLKALSGATTQVSSFDQAITIMMRYTDAEVASYLESSLWIYRWDGSSWNTLSSCTVDTSANTVTCTTTAFSDFGLFGTESSSTTSTTTTTSVSTSNGGHRGSSASMAERIAAARSFILARYEGQQTQVIAMEEDEALHAAAEENDETLAPNEVRRLERAQQKITAVIDQKTPTISEQRGRLQVMLDNESILYKDVPTDAWFAPYIAMLIEENIAQGYKDEEGNPKGEFGVANPITYAEVLKMALEAAGYDVSNVAPPRNVSARGSWANAYVSKAEELGLSLFNPDLDVHSASTRGEVVQIILEVLKLPIAKQTAQFSDVLRSHPYANAIATAAFYGFIAGDTDADADGNPLNTFRPDEQINRAEVAKIIGLVKEATR